MNVHIVIGRNHDGSFEFARQIGFTQNRLDLIGNFFIARLGRLGRKHFFAVQPHIGICHRARQKVHTDARRPFIGFLVQRALHRIAGAQHITVDIAGCSNGIQTKFVQCLMRLF